MRTDHSEKLILAAGIAVLGVSLAVPAARELSSRHDVRDMASKVVDLQHKLMSSAEPGKTLSVRVKHLVDGLAPDAALADGKLQQRSAPDPEATPPHPEVAADEKSTAAEATEESDLKVVVEWSGAGDAKIRLRKTEQPASWAIQGQ
jgi:hypothetical protein